MKNLIFILASIFFVACSNNTQVVQKPKSNEPAWLNNPEFIKDKLNAIGCAGIHINGENEQKKLAISRAIEQIAMQKNSKVNVVTYRTKNATDGVVGSSKTQTSSLQEVNNQSLSTKVFDSYKDKDGRICVLVIEE